MQIVNGKMLYYKLMLRSSNSFLQLKSIQLNTKENFKYDTDGLHTVLCLWNLYLLYINHQIVMFHFTIFTHYGTAINTRLDEKH